MRAWLLSAHYRSPLEFSEEGLAAAKARVDRMRAAAAKAEAYFREGGVGHSLSREERGLKAEIDGAVNSFFEGMSDDFNTARALAALDRLASLSVRITEGSLSPNLAFEAWFWMNDLSGILGLDLGGRTAAGMERSLISLLLEVRRELRRRKMWDLSDEIRSRLRELGVRVEDRGVESVWWVE